MVRLALALLHRSSVNIHCCSYVGMAHQFLLHFHRSPSLIEKTPEGMAECVPTDMANTATDGRGSNMPLLYSPRLPAVGTSHPDSMWTSFAFPVDTAHCGFPWRSGQAVARSRWACVALIYRDDSLGFLGDASGRFPLDYPPFTDKEVGSAQRWNSSIESRLFDGETRAVLPVAVPAVQKGGTIEGSSTGGSRFRRYLGAGDARSRETAWKFSEI